MKKIIILFFAFLLFVPVNIAQFNRYMSLGKDSYNKQKYRLAVERFDLAIEFANEDKNKKEYAKTWKSKTWKTIDSLIWKQDSLIPEIRPITGLEKKALLREGNLCFNIEEYDCAAISYSKVLESNSDNIEILVKLRKCYAYLGDYQKNYYLTLKLMKLDSALYKNYYNFSFYALFNKDYDGARKAAKISLLMKPDRKMVNSNLALAHILNNQYKKAKKIYARYKNKALYPYTNRAKVNFLEDIKKLEKAGVHHKDFIKAKKFLRE